MLCLVPAVLVSWTGVARAGGLELAPGGSHALGRGGAVLAKPHNAMALQHNGAGLAEVAGNSFLLNLDWVFHDMCFEPYGYYGWGASSTYGAGPSEFPDLGARRVRLDQAGAPVETDLDGNPVPPFASDRLDRVCNSAPDLPLPQLAMALRLGERLVLGFGFVGPTVVPGSQWGGDDGTISTPDGTRPTPTRYQLIKTEFAGAFPQVGIGFKVLPRLNIGLVLGWGILTGEATMVHTRAAGTSPHNDMLAVAKARDLFLPSATASVHFIPIDALEIMASFVWRDSFEGSGEIEYQTATYHQGATVGAIPHDSPPIELERAYNRLPWVLNFGIRYADRLRPRGAPAEGNDPFEDERWDIELDATYTFNERAAASETRIEDTCEYDDSGQRIPARNADQTLAGYSRGCQRLEFVRRDPTGVEETSFLDLPVPGFADVSGDSGWKDSVAVRVGGSYNVIPGSLALHAGGAIESRSVDFDYTNIDIMGLGRLTLGLGLTWRLGNWDLMVSYGHIFQKRAEIAPPAHQPATEDDEDEPRAGFDKRVGFNCTGAPDCTFEPLAEHNPPNDPDGVAELRQNAVSGGERQPRVVNAGVYEASFDIVSFGFNYRF